MRNHYTNRICGIGLSGTHSAVQKEEKYIDITLGVFFDGTGNNKYNIYFNQRAKKQYRKNYDSYKGSFTNVALLWEMYDASNPYTERVYIEGPGTAPPKRGSRQFADAEGWASSGKEDSKILGQGFGSGFLFGLGVGDKIKRAYDVIIEKVSSICRDFQKQRVRSITFDVFGFSRGATASRLFIRTILLDKYSSFRVRLEKIVGRLDSLQIKIRFLGLFDTVSSIGLGEIMSDSKKHSQLFIPDKAKSVKTVVHLIAANEYRRYFPLTTVTSARYLGRNCMEYILPGAHSDIGGGYSEIEMEPLYMDGTYSPWKEVNNRTSRDFRGYMSLADLRNRKWISDSDYQEAIKKYSKGYYKTEPYRHVHNEYSRIPL